jgi:predicted AAA+ superfamily ATPase
MVNTSQLKRAVEETLKERLSIMPAVVITGARQTGKSTLARSCEPKGRRYLTLDDLDILGAAQRDPELLVGGPGKITIDEIQREPSLLSAVKNSIDKDRYAGRFILTGSANLLLMNRVSESLAGRASYLTLWPMTRREQLGLGRHGIWDRLVQANDGEWIEVFEDQPVEPEDWRQLALRGGFPTPAVHLKRANERRIWFDGYVRTYLERDLQDIASISALPDFRRFMQAAALRLGSLINQSEIARDTGIPQPTIHRYLNLLETSYMAVRLRSYSVNRTKRLMRSPKLYWGDTGIALHLSGSPSPSGEHLENLILCDLLCWRDSSIEQIGLYFWRTATGEEVDIVIDHQDELIPIEIKSANSVRFRDAKNIISFQREYKDRTRQGLLLYNGDETFEVAPGVIAAPWWKVI